MSNPAIFFDDWETPKPILLDFYQTNNIWIRIATRTAKIFIKDSENRLIDYSCVYPTANYAINREVNGNSIIISYSNVKTTEQLKLYARAGTKDVVSIALITALSVNGSNYVINDWYNWLNQFPTLESVNIFFARQSTFQSPFPIIKGNMIRVPKQVKYVAYERLYLENPNVDFYCDFNNINADSQLKYFIIDLLVSQVPKVVGDLNNLPSTLEYFKIVNFGTGSNAVYTGVGKIFSPTIDTFYFNRALSTAQLDQLLIDLNNSVTTAIGDKLIYIMGTRSYVSDATVASLQAKGFTVNVNRVLNNVSNADSAILRLDFQNNFDVYSNSGLNIGAGGMSNPPTFALSGRKPGEYCAVFNGSQSIKTTTNLPINSDKVTIAFWIKKNTQPLSGMVIYETGNSETLNLFAGVLNENGNSFLSRSRNSGINENKTDTPNNTWIHIVTVIDRSENGNNEIKTYVNGALAASTKPNSVDNNGNFLNDILYIGQRAGSEFGFIGMITRFRIENYAYTASQVLNLYNSEL